MGPFCRFVLTSCTLTAALIAVTAGAETLSIDQAVERGLESNLGLMAKRFDVAMARADVITASLRPNPNIALGADYQDVLGSNFAHNPKNGAGPPEADGRLEIPIETFGKRKLRMEVAGHAKAVEEELLLDAARRLVYEIQSTCVDLVLARERVDLARKNLDVLREVVELDSARVKDGDIPEVDLQRSRLAALGYEVEVRAAMRDRTIPRTRLWLLLGAKSGVKQIDVGGGFRHDTPPPLTELQRDAQESRPDLQALERAEQGANADVRLQNALAKVDVDLGIGYHYQYGYANGQSLGFFLSVPLPIFDRNQGGIERANQRTMQVGVELQALRAALEREVENAYERYLTARDQLQLLDGQMVGAARDVRDTNDYAYRHGGASLLEFLDAQRAYNDTMRTRLEAAAEYARALYLLESVSGRKL